MDESAPYGDEVGEPRGEDAPRWSSRPPQDPDDWTDEEWLDWLCATDAISGEPETPHRTRPGRISRSAGGQVLGNAMLGVANALYGRKDQEVVIVAEAPGEPDEDEPFSVHLDPEHPERSQVVLRHPKS